MRRSRASGGCSCLSVAVVSSPSDEKIFFCFPDGAAECSARPAHYVRRTDAVACARMHGQVEEPEELLSDRNGIGVRFGLLACLSILMFIF